MLREVSLASPVYRKQRIILGEEVLTILDSPQGLVIGQWRFDELVDMAFFQPHRNIGGAKVERPYGEIRLARTWNERRLGLYESHPRNPLGIQFLAKKEQEAFALYQELRSLPKFTQQLPPFLAQVETERFVLTLNNRDLVVTYRSFYHGLKQSMFTKARTEEPGESSFNLDSITGMTIEPPSDDLIHYGQFNGRLIIHGAQGRTTGFGRGSLELDFAKSSEQKVRQFVSFLESHLFENENSSSELESTGSRRSVTKELKELVSMFESGHLTFEEYELAKNKLLSE